jgi:RimJ/RimL family protein N-acetyltransferase
MRISWLQIFRGVEFHADVATARTLCDEHRSAPALCGEVCFVRFAPPLVPAVVAAQSPRRVRQFLQFDAEGESGWLATDGAGKVIGYCWRLDNQGRIIIRREVNLPCGWSWFHHAWTAPGWRGKGIMPALLYKSMSDALAEPAWSVQGFMMGIEAANHASQRTVAKAGFKPVRHVTSLRVGTHWFLLHSEVTTES